MGITDEIKARLDIVEVISSYVPLQKAGRTYKGLCPFHSEKTPSFVVFPESQNWHCFGACGTGGDIFSFIMKRENLSFGEALKLLAERAGVELPARSGAPSADEGRLERLRQIVGDAAVYFHYLLNKASEAQVARDYLARRGLNQATWETWQLGYALDSWDGLLNRLVAKGYPFEDIEAAGLIIRRENDSGYYDRFRGRLMIPIRDVQGRTIGFGARLLREDPVRPQPKYINSPQTPLFDKSSVLFGLDMARGAIREANQAVIVEGYMDVLMSHQVGVCNVVAGMGTALTEAQMQQLKRFTSNLTLALDPDTAGDHATLRGLETARQTLDRDWVPVLSPTGLVRQESRLKAQVRIATLPAGLDPDELAYRDVAQWREVIAQAQPIVDYYLALVARQEDLTTAHGKARALERLAPLIQEIANPLERSHHIQRLARLIQADERLVEEQIAVAARPADAGLRRQDARPTRQHTAVPTPPEPPAEQPGEAITFGMEEHLLGCLLARPDLLARLDADMIAAGAPPPTVDDFITAENRAIMSALLELTATTTDGLDADGLPVAVPDAVRARCVALLAHVSKHPPLPDERLVKDLGDSLLRLRERNLSQQIKQIKYLLLEAQETSAHDQVRQFAELMVAYTAQKRQVHKLLNARTMAGMIAQAQRKN